jgi:hypothetical protein
MKQLNISSGSRVVVFFVIVLFLLLTSTSGLTKAHIDDNQLDLEINSDILVDECADCPKSFAGMSDGSLRLDTGGCPHIAYGGDHL